MIIQTKVIASKRILILKEQKKLTLKELTIKMELTNEIKIVKIL